jgi:hypothetical protein
MNTKIIAMVMTLISLLSSVNALAQGSHETGGGRITETQLKMLLLDLIPYFESKEGLDYYPKVLAWNNTHADEPFVEVLRKMAPVMKNGPVRDNFDADRDCISHFSDPSNRYFECNQNAKWPAFTLDTEQAYLDFVLHEAFVQTRIERSRNSLVTSTYDESSRLPFHLESFQKWMPGKKITKPTQYDSVTDSVTSSKGPTGCAARLAFEALNLRFRTQGITSYVVRTHSSIDEDEEDLKQLKPTTEMPHRQFRITGNYHRDVTHFAQEIHGYIGASFLNHFHPRTRAFEYTQCWLAAMPVQMGGLSDSPNDHLNDDDWWSAPTSIRILGKTTVEYQNEDMLINY